MKFIEVNGAFVNLEQVVLIEPQGEAECNGDWAIRFYLSSGLMIPDYEVSYGAMMARYCELKSYIGGVQN